MSEFPGDEVVPGIARGLWFGGESMLVHQTLLGQNIRGRTAHNTRAKPWRFRHVIKNFRRHSRLRLRLRIPNVGTNFRAQLIMKRGTKAIIAFDFLNLRVSKHRTEGFSRRYSPLRSHYSKFLPTASFVLQNYTVIEDLVTGQQLDMLEDDRRIEITLAVLQRLKGLLDEPTEAVGVDRVEWTDALDTSFPSLPAFPVRLRGDFDAARHWLSRSRLVASHGELKPSHVLCNSSGDFYAIDLDTVGLRPAWFDAIYVSLGWRERNFTQERAGVFDSALRALCPPGAPSDPVKFRRALVAGWIALALQDTTLGYMSSEADADRYLKTWEPFLESRPCSSHPG